VEKLRELSINLKYYKMKSTKIRLVSILILLTFSGTIFSQEEEEEREIIVDQIEGVFEGYNEELGTYNFDVSYEEGDEIITDTYEFVIKDERILKKFNLKSDEFIGNYFTIKFTVKVVSIFNEEEEIEEFVEVYTIIEINNVE